MTVEQRLSLDLSPPSLHRQYQESGQERLELEEQKQEVRVWKRIGPLDGVLLSVGQERVVPE